MEQGKIIRMVEDNQAPAFVELRTYLALCENAHAWTVYTDTNRRELAQARCPQCRGAWKSALLQMRVVTEARGSWNEGCLCV